MGRLPLADVAVLNAPHIIGHARLATMGAAHDDPAGLQPVHVDGHWLAHNGNVYNAGQLDPDAPTDSGALATCYAGHRRFGGMTPAEALKAAIALADQRAWAIIILDSTGQLLATRFRLPIWRHADDTGAYYSSRPFAAAELIPEDTVHAEAAW